jgi:peptidoglycan/LPS O-acetylase OafA/YrhL
MGDGNRRRPALDGLRGLAALGVILAHAGTPFMTGAGTLGVTLFFVLSGFLITRLLVEELERTGRIDLRSFYLRRLRRLGPPLVVFLAVVTALLVGTGEPLWGALSALTFTSNFASLVGVPLHLVGHTWSLSHEEQFYLLWPLVLIVLGRRHLTRLTPALAVVAVLVAANRIMLAVSGASLIRSFYSPDTRSDALLVGCLLALVLHRSVSLRVGRWAALAGVILLACAPFGREPLVVLLVPATLSSAVLVAWAWTTAGGGLLASAPIRGFGRISYAVFLWHMPTTELFLNIGLPWWQNVVLTMVVSTVLAMASWRWVELPVLRGGRSGSTSPVAVPGVTSALGQLIRGGAAPAAVDAAATPGFTSPRGRG